MNTPATPGRERRIHRRRATNVPMWIDVGGKRVAVSAVNVSVGGAAVHTSAKADVGELVRLDVGLGRGPGAALDAEVVRAEQGLLGLRFLALGQRALEALLEAAGFRAEPAEDDPSGVHHLGPDESSRRGA